MNVSWKRSPALLAVISWSLSLVLLAGYQMTLQPAAPASPSADPPTSQRCPYSAYLSTHLREGGYFERCPEGVWAVIRYRIGPGGSLISSEVVESRGDRADVQYILDGVRVAAPFKPFGGREPLEVIELFWTEGDTMTPGSVAEALRVHGDDGRILRYKCATARGEQRSTSCGSASACGSASSSCAKAISCTSASSCTSATSTASASACGR